MREICTEIGLPDLSKSDVSKQQIKEAIFYSHYISMKQEIDGSSKLEEIRNQDFRHIQPYFMEKSMANTRLAFRIRTKMVQKIPGNFKNMYKNNKAGLKCSFCTESIMTQSNCNSCPGMVTLRDGLELMKMDDMVVFFRRIVKERSKK